MSYWKVTVYRSVSEESLGEIIGVNLRKQEAGFLFEEDGVLLSSGDFSIYTQDGHLILGDNLHLKKTMPEE